MVLDFTDLLVWKRAHKLTILVYQATEGFPKRENYGLSNQLRRAAVSVEANIAEGHGRYHYADEINFFIMARGSCAEARTLVLLARDIKYLDTRTSAVLLENYTILTKQINSYIAAKRKKLSR